MFHVGLKYVDQVLDSLYVIETAMRHFFLRRRWARTPGAIMRRLMPILRRQRTWLRWWHHIGTRGCQP
jgi:hypothetical protein